MRKALVLGIAGLLLIGLGSCFPRYGWPKNVKFPRSGGVKEITGETDVYWFEIRNWNGDKIVSAQSIYIDGEIKEWPDSLIATYEWLTVKAAYNDNKLTLIADPENRNNHHLIIGIADGNSEIEVIVKME